MKPELILFVLACVVVAGAMIAFAVIAMPELVRYNLHLSAIEENVARCNCSAVCVRSLPAYALPGAT